MPKRAPYEKHGNTIRKKLANKQGNTKREKLAEKKGDTKEKKLAQWTPEQITLVRAVVLDEKQACADALRKNQKWGKSKVCGLVDKIKKWKRLSRAKGKGRKASVSSGQAA